MTTPLRRALFALALSFAVPLAPTSVWATPAQTAPATVTLRARVSDAAGQAVVGADVVVVQRDDDYKPKITAFKTDAQGRFEIAGVKPKFGVEAFVYLAGYALQREFVVPDSDNGITLKKGESASGKVVDADGKPVAGARVKMTRLVLSAEDAGDFRFRYVQIDALENSVLTRALETKTDANGVWELADLPIGSQGTFQLDDPRFARDEKFGSPGENKQIVPDLKATPGANLKGRVVAPDGKPVAGAQINVNVGEKQSSYAETVTAKDGTYSLQSLPPGDAAIKVKSPDSPLAPTSIKGVAVVAGGTATAPDIKLGAGVLLTGKIIDKDSKAPVAGARVMIQGDFGDVPTTVSGKDGTYQARVPQGKIRFYIYSYPRGYVQEDFADANSNITAASTKAPDFTIARGLTLTGKALDETGAPAAKATIIAGSDWDGAQSSVDDAGNWTIEGVDNKPNGRNGKVRLKTDGDWQIVGDGLVAAREGDKIALTLRRIECQDVTLRIVTPEGEPVEGAKVRFDIMFDPTNHSTRFETAVSNARGEVTVKRLRPDESVEVKPEKVGYALQKAGVITMIEANKTRATDAIMTPKNGVLRGRVVDADGVAVVGARIAVLWPGDLRDAKTLAQSGADGKFELNNLRAGELLVGAAHGRDFGQVKAQTGGEIEIKLAAATPQPLPQDRALARQVLERWFADSKPAAGATLANFAANIANTSSQDDGNFATRSTDGQLWFEREQTPELVQAQQQQAIQTARAKIEAAQNLEARDGALLDLATLLLQNGDKEGARAAYERAEPDLINASKTNAADVSSLYRYAQLAGITSAIEHRNASFWIEILDRALPEKPTDEMMFGIGSYMKTFAENDIDGALDFMETLAPIAQIRASEDVIPIVAKRDLPRAQELLTKMDALFARGDIPIEPDRNDGMYRPTPARSLDVARAAIIRALLPTDARAAYAQSLKITDENGYGLASLQTETALRLPVAEVLPILRAQFAQAQNKDNRSVGAMAKLAKLAAPFDAKLSEQWFEMARQRLTENPYGDDRTREMAANYAFYRADSDPAESRLLLENEWQRNIKTKSDDEYYNASRLQYIMWAMVPVDWERALQMIGESKGKLDSRYVDDLMTQHNLTAWLLASEQERREMDFDRPSAELLK